MWLTFDAVEYFWVSFCHLTFHLPGAWLSRVHYYSAHSTLHSLKTKTIWKEVHLKTILLVLPWWSSDWDTTLPTPGACVQSLVRSWSPRAPTKSLHATSETQCSQINTYKYLKNISFKKYSNPFHVMYMCMSTLSTNSKTFSNTPLVFF